MWIGGHSFRVVGILKAALLVKGAYNGLLLGLGPVALSVGGVGVAALVIGAVAGLYPSMRAARMSPTEALRTV
jgi:putative ABC transport system permease protein